MAWLAVFWSGTTGSVKSWGTFRNSKILSPPLLPSFIPSLSPFSLPPSFPSSPSLSLSLSQVRRLRQKQASQHL